MPRRAGGWKRMELVSVAERREMIDRCQEHWYKLAAGIIAPGSVLDVGAGTGYGMDILREAGCCRVEGIDPLPLRPDIHARDISRYDAWSWDWCVAMDVIEHVEGDVGFLLDLLRVSRRGVFLSTPNWNVFHAQNEYHVREYTPAEIDVLTRGHERRWWTSGADLVARSIEGPESADMHFGVLIKKE